MPHKLEPATEPLEPIAFCQRLVPEFGYVVKDVESADLQLDRMVAHFTSRGAAPEVIEKYRGLRGRSFMLLPGEPVLVGYSSPEHEQAARGLLERVCRVTGYEAEQA